MRVELVTRKIPRSAGGDPAFTHLGVETELQTSNNNLPLTCLLGVFTPAEIVELCNRALYQLEYQRTAHRNRAQNERDRTKPIRQKVREMFKVSWLKATDAQVDAATEAVRRERENGGL